MLPNSYPKVNFTLLIDAVECQLFGNQLAEINFTDHRFIEQYTFHNSMLCNVPFLATHRLFSRPSYVYYCPTSQFNLIRCVFRHNILSTFTKLKNVFLSMVNDNALVYFRIYKFESVWFKKTGTCH